MVIRERNIFGIVQPGSYVIPPFRGPLRFKCDACVRVYAKKDKSRDMPQKISKENSLQRRPKEINDDDDAAACCLL